MNRNCEHGNWEWGTGEKVKEQVYNADHFDNFFKTLLFTNIP